MRLVAYGAISTLVASGVVLQAFHQRANFYSACVHLAQSNACVMILTNFGFFITLMFGKIIQKIFYGPLRPVEVEHLYEKAWYAITETCLAMTIFRDEFHSGFVMMFTILLFLKCFHWLGIDRVDWMEQAPPARPYLFHARLASSLISMFLLDIVLTRHCVLTLMQLPKPNMLVMFAFEFAILTVGGSSTLARYVIGIVEKIITARKTKQLRERRTRVLRRRVERGLITEEEMRDTLLEEEEAGDVVGTWEAKSNWLFNAEIATDLVKLLIYFVFFSIVLMFYGLPLHIVRDVYMTVRSFITRCRDYIRYKKATTQMNSKYPDATPEEIARETTCIICRETMKPWGENTTQQQQQPADADALSDEDDVMDERLRPKKLPCGHVLHLACIKSWMERQQTCPICRRPVLDEPVTAQPNAQGAGAGAANAGGNLPQGAGQPANQQGQGQAQAPNQGQGQGQAQPGQPGQPGQANGGPVGFGLNMFGGGGGGGLVQALARNLAQRQNGLQPLFNQNAQGAQQNQPAQQFQQAQQNQQPGQQNQPAQQNQQPTQPTQPAPLNQQAQGFDQNRQLMGHELATHLYESTTEMVRVAIEDVVRQQNAWNARLSQEMGEVIAQLRETRRALGQSTWTDVFASQEGAAGARSSSMPNTTTATPSNNPDPVVGSSSGPRLPVPNISPTPTRSEAGAAQGESNNSTATNADDHGNQAFPPGFQLPPGWSIIPLFPVAQGRPLGSGFPTPQRQQQGVVYNTPSPLPHQHQHQHPYQPSSGTTTLSTTHIPPSPSPSAPAGISLSDSGIRRRGVQRQYSNNLHTYHSMASPRQEDPNPFAPSTQAPTSSTMDATTTTATAASPSTAPNSGLTRNQQTANSNGLNNLSSPSRQVNSSHNHHGTSSSPSRHGSISTTSREVLERRHRDAHSPRPPSNLSPAGSVRISLSNNNNNNIQNTTLTGDSSIQQGSPIMGPGIVGGNGRRAETPHIDTSAEHNHPLDSTHDPTQGRSPIEERRRASAGEILLSETDTSWPAPADSGPTSEASLSPTPSLPGSRVGSIRRNRRSSGAGLAGVIVPGNGSPVGTTSIFNVIPKSQASSTVGSPVMGHSLGRFDLGSPSRISLDKGKEKDDSGNGGAEADDTERGRSRIKEEEEES
ncbi:E3 ubiquitin-protein ligase hrd1 [Orbilia blumenaviensis]|uniref:RING-type E3 ubiquitin transferase n=1 Tax=Orbilia blumenaviensis TaxID=1796055 RepID=A0AAV9UMK0_9PEZI